MIIINIRNADGFTRVDNFYRIPDSMSVDDALAFAAETAQVTGDAGWEWFDGELADKGIVPVEIPHIDVVF